MKIKIILISLISFLFIQTATAQTAKEADPKDVSSVDAIMKAVYDVISGDADKVQCVGDAGGDRPLYRGRTERLRARGHHARGVEEEPALPEQEQLHEDKTAEGNHAVG